MTADELNANAEAAMEAMARAGEKAEDKPKRTRKAKADTRHDEGGIAVLDTTSDEGDRVLYSLDNCYDIFGRCLGYPLPFEQIERVFDELWHQRKRWTFEQIHEAMYREE